MEQNQKQVKVNIKLDKELQRGLDIFNNSFNGGLDLTNIIKALKR